MDTQTPARPGLDLSYLSPNGRLEHAPLLTPTHAYSPVLTLTLIHPLVPTAPKAYLQTWPELEKIPTHAQSTVAATSSTSSNTSMALLPPSSRWTSVGPAFAAASITLARERETKECMQRGVRKRGRFAFGFSPLDCWSRPARRRLFGNAVSRCSKEIAAKIVLFYGVSCCNTYSW